MNNATYLFAKIIAVIFTLAPLFASAEPKWDYSKKVKYKKMAILVGLHLCMIVM